MEPIASLLCYITPEIDNICLSVSVISNQHPFTLQFHELFLLKNTLNLHQLFNFSHKKEIQYIISVILTM